MLLSITDFECFKPLALVLLARPATSCIACTAENVLQLPRVDTGMSCPHCEALALERAISSPNGLRAALRDAAAAIARRALRDEGCGDESEPLSQVLVGRWGDVVSHYFSCPHCGQWFHLFAETYHGRCGAFAPCLAPRLAPPERGETS